MTFSTLYLFSGDNLGDFVNTGISRFIDSNKNI